MADPIIFCEPQCTGFEHSVFNAALLSTVLLAYPESRVQFLAEGEHLRWVKENFSKHRTAEGAGVEWVELKIPPRNVGGFRRIPYEWKWCPGVLRRARSSRAAAIIFSSLPDSGIIVLKTLQYLFRSKIPMIAGIHSMINVLLDRRPFGFFRHGKGVRIALALPHPGSLRYLLLGESLVRELAKIEPRTASRSIGLDIPYLWPPEPASDHPQSAGKATFGFFGVSAEKGFATFYNLAMEIQGEYPGVSFELIGYLSSEAERAQYAGKLKNISSTPLSPQEYARRANGVTYAVWTTDPERYRLCASSSFLDILSYVKPGVYLSNLYLEHNFRRMGDIGYLCADVAEMKSTLAGIIKNFPADRYSSQQRNILSGRGLFEPGTLAPRLRQLIEEVRTTC